MELVRTICCKLDPTPEQAVEIEATLEAFASAFPEVLNPRVKQPAALRTRNSFDRTM